MAMLPRMKPKTFYDLVIEVAIVRPGPIQGDMVHPYLRRREGRGAGQYPTPELRARAGKDARRAAVPGAGDAGRDRSAPASRRPRPISCAAPWRPSSSRAASSKFRDKLIDGHDRRAATTQEFAERTFKQLEGFGSYGFPESHAASLRADRLRLVLDEMPPSRRVLLRHPQRAADGLLRAGPARARCRQHGVEVRPVDVNHSRWDCTLEPVDDGPASPSGSGCGWPRGSPTRMAHGSSPRAATRLRIGRGSLAARRRPASPRSSGWPRPTRFGSLGLSRREALWADQGLARRPAAAVCGRGRRGSSRLRPESIEPAVVLDADDAGPRGRRGLSLEGPDACAGIPSPSCATI